MIKIAQTSDTHIGITKTKTVRKMFQKLQEEQFDVFVHCGDYCGAQMGHKTLGVTVKLFREIFPDKPFISVLGNHDFWCRKGKREINPSLEDFQKNYRKIIEIFETNNVHFLDEKGPIVLKGWTFMGHSGWYNHPNPPTNDCFFLPNALEGNTNGYLLKRANDAIGDQLDFYPPDLSRTIFVSHFPVIKAEDYKGSFDDYSWSARLGEILHEVHGIQYFLNGHAHQLHTGPLRYESGSDYCEPRYHILEFK